MNRRAQARFGASLPVRLRACRTPIVTHTVDVSASGLRFESPRPLQAKDPLLVDLFVPGTELWLTVAATVRWCDGRSVGVEFSHDPWSRELMGRLLARIA